jgi:hypothetical protein
MKERAMRDLEKLTPEQRNEVWRSVWAVLNLPAEERQKLIGNEDERRQKVKEEIDRMLKNTGIQVPDDQRRKFFHRYFSGRRSIEEQVKKEGEERRQALMTELEGKLKQEFGSTKTDQTQLEQQKKVRRCAEVASLGTVGMPALIPRMGDRKKLGLLTGRSCATL